MKKITLITGISLLAFTSFATFAENYGSSNSVSVECYGSSKNCVFTSYANSDKFCTYKMHLEQSEGAAYAPKIKTYSNSGAFRISPNATEFVENISVNLITKVDLNCSKSD